MPEYRFPEENVTPQDFECVTFFYPNNDHYLNQLIHSYQHFGKWNSWERDSDKTGTVVAEMWRQAFLISQDNNFMPSVNLEPEINVNVDGPEITVNCNCGGGSGGGSGGGDGLPIVIVIPPDATDDPSVPPVDDIDYGPDPESVPEPYQEVAPTPNDYNILKCRAANFYAGNLIKSFELIRVAVDTLSENGIRRVALGLALALSDGGLPFGDVAGILVIVIPFFMPWLRSGVSKSDEIAQFILTMDKCEIADIIYGATTRSDLGSSLSSYLKSRVDGTSISDLGKTALNVWISYALENRFANYVFSGMDVLVPSDTPIECPCAGLVIDSPANQNVLFDFTNGNDGFSHEGVGITYTEATGNTNVQGAFGNGTDFDASHLQMQVPVNDSSVEFSAKYSRDVSGFSLNADGSGSQAIRIATLSNNFQGSTEIVYRALWSDGSESSKIRTHGENGNSVRSVDITVEAERSGLQLISIEVEIPPQLGALFNNSGTTVFRLYAVLLDMF